jgi:hypothetical protein
VSYKQVRHAFQSQAAKDPRLWDTFHVCRVFTAIQRHKPPPTSAEPSPRIPAVLHVASDEIQTAFHKKVPNFGSWRPLQPLSGALNRALQGHMSQARGIFFIGTLSGTSARHPDEVLEPMDGTSATVLLPSLSADSIRQLVASFRFKPQPGHSAMVRGQEWLERLATLGGNPRALECLERVLQDEGSPSESLCLDDISAKLIAQVQRTFKVEDWARQMILLALAGNWKCPWWWPKRRSRSYTSQSPPRAARRGPHATGRLLPHGPELQEADP